MKATGVQFSAIVALDSSTRCCARWDCSEIRKRRCWEVAWPPVGCLVDAATPTLVRGRKPGHDQPFWQRARAGLEGDILVVFDLGFVHHGHFDLLTGRGVSFITRRKKNAVSAVVSLTRDEAALRSSIIHLGSASARCRFQFRLGEVALSGHLLSLPDGRSGGACADGRAGGGPVSFALAHRGCLQDGQTLAGTSLLLRGLPETIQLSFG